MTLLAEVPDPVIVFPSTEAERPVIRILGHGKETGA
jgi:hypothetical protein